MKKIGQIKDHECAVIASNMEKYTTFILSIHKDKHKITLRFIDSFQFMPASLEKLEENLTPDQFSILRDNFLNGASCYY